MKTSSLVAALATPGGLRRERGWEAGEGCAGGFVRAPSPAGEQALGCRDEEARLERVGHIAERLREALERAALIADLGCQVRVVEARVRDEALEGGGAEARVLLTAQAFVGPDAHRPHWTRLTLPLVDPPSWPVGFVPTLARLVSGPRRPSRPGGRALAGCAELVLDAFAFSDLLRWASRVWAAGSRGPLADISTRLEVDECDLSAGPEARRAPVLREATLLATPGSLGLRTRASWRERPRPDWRGLEARLPEGGETPLLAGTLLLTTLHFLPGALLGEGLALDEGGEGQSVPLLALPRPESLLSALVAARGPAVIDASGLPIRAPAALLDRDRVFRALR